MNKFVRGTLITGLIVLVLGIGLVIAGFAAGATWQNVGEVIFSGRFSFNSRSFGVVSDIGTGPGEEMSDESIILEQVDVKKLEKVTIHMGAGDLDVEEGKSGYFQINNKVNRGHCFVDYADDELTITFKGKNYGRGAKATVWIPKGIDIEDIELRVDAGKVTTADIKGKNITATVGAGQLVTGVIEATNLTMEVDAGQIKIDDVKTTNLSVDVDAGEFRNDGKIVADTASLHVSAGNLNVDLLEAKDADIDVDMGHINVKFTGKADDYDIEADCDLGEIKIDGKSYHMGKEYESKNSTAKKSINVDCNVGQATVNFEN